MNAIGPAAISHAAAAWRLLEQGFDRAFGAPKNPLRQLGALAILALSILAASGQTAEGSFALDREGRYVVICFIPTGLETAKLEELGVDISALGPDTDPATLSSEAQAYIAEVSANPPHFTQGMIQEFTVTAAGTAPGPLPEVDAAD